MKTQRRYKNRAVDGILLLDKPGGITSNAALQKAKRLFHAEKAGHTGSLDPMATGLLPICFGQATKLSAFILEADKRYRARACLGAKTTSGDVDGEVIATSDATAITREQLAAVIPKLLGTIDQIPPMVSAIKREGQHLYELARQGIEIEREPRRITIHELLLLDCFDGGFEFEVLCSKGTYVRTLAEDWAAALGQCAHLTALRRLETGPFKAHDMIAALQLEAAGDNLAALDTLLLPLSAALAGWPRLNVSAVDTARLRGGLICGPFPGTIAGPVAVFDGAGIVHFIAELDAGGRLAPKRWIGPERDKP